MKKFKIINILILCVFASFLFSGNDMNTSGNRGYDAEIKSEILQIRNDLEVWYDDNEENYLEYQLPSNLIPPGCSDDKQYNITISEGGQNYAIWGNLCSSNGYWCADSNGEFKNVKNDNVPTKENIICPSNSPEFIKNEKIEDYKENTIRLSKLILLAIIIYIIYYIIIKNILRLINKYFLENKLNNRNINNISFNSVVNNLGFILIYYITLLIFAYIANSLSIDLGFMFIIHLLIIVLFVYLMIKNKLNKYKEKLSVNKIRNLSIFIIIYNILTIVFVLFILSFL